MARRYKFNYKRGPKRVTNGANIIIADTATDEEIAYFGLKKLSVGLS